jgi:hypothetical protein
MSKNKKNRYLIEKVSVINGDRKLIASASFDVGAGFKPAPTGT